MRRAIESWLDLARLIEELVRQETTWIFRGEPSTTNELRPAAGAKAGGAPGLSAMTSSTSEQHCAVFVMTHCPTSATSRSPI
jgi:hypothetical protein